MLGTHPPQLIPPWRGLGRALAGGAGCPLLPGHPPIPAGCFSAGVTLLPAPKSRLGAEPASPPGQGTPRQLLPPARGRQVRRGPLNVPPTAAQPESSPQHPDPGSFPGSPLSPCSPPQEGGLGAAALTERGGHRGAQPAAGGGPRGGGLLRRHQPAGAAATAPWRLRVSRHLWARPARHGYGGLGPRLHPNPCGERAQGRVEGAAQPHRAPAR